MEAGLDGPDFFPTPAWATFALIDNEAFRGDIWESASGNDAMSDVLAESGPPVRVVHVSPHPRSHPLYARRTDGALDFGAGSDAVEIDETFIGKKHEKAKGARGYAHKNAMLTLMDRNSRKSRPYVVESVKAPTLCRSCARTIDKEAVVYTDETAWYNALNKDFAAHDFVCHNV